MTHISDIFIDIQFILGYNVKLDIPQIKVTHGEHILLSKYTFGFFLYTM